MKTGFVWQILVFGWMAASGASAADRVIPVYPGTVVIDSQEQAETEKKVRQQAIDDARARAREKEAAEGQPPPDAFPGATRKTDEKDSAKDKPDARPEPDPGVKLTPTPD